jgi:hypothetical protein
MTRPLTIICILTAAALCLLIGFWWLPLIAHEPHDRTGYGPTYHGADLITVGWQGELVAYKWQDGKYETMWGRR